MIDQLPKIAFHIERGVRLFCWWAAWFNVILFVVILIQVLLRYLFSGVAELGGSSQIILGELQWHLYSVALMFGLAYSQIYNSHVRVDALSRKFSDRTRSVVEILGILLLMYPFLIIMFLQGLDYVATAWRINERSASPVGLPWRWLIKSIIPAAFFVLFMALTARLLREVAFLAGGEVQPAYQERFGRFRQQHIGGGAQQQEGGRDGS